MKRLLAIATAFTMTAVMLAGCGSSTNDSTNILRHQNPQHRNQYSLKRPRAAQLKQAKPQMPRQIRIRYTRLESASFCSMMPWMPLP